MTAKLEGGEIVLLHDSDYYAASDSWQSTLDALPRILHELGEKGLQPVPITSAQMLRKTPPIVGRHAPRP